MIRPRIDRCRTPFIHGSFLARGCGRWCPTSRNQPVLPRRLLDGVDDRGEERLGDRRHDHRDRVVAAGPAASAPAGWRGSRSSSLDRQPGPGRLVSAATVSSPLVTRETVLVLTPAARATRIVTFDLTPAVPRARRRGAVADRPAGHACRPRAPRRDPRRPRRRPAARTTRTRPRAPARPPPATRVPSRAHTSPPTRESPAPIGLTTETWGAAQNCVRSSVAKAAPWLPALTIAARAPSSVRPRAAVAARSTTSSPDGSTPSTSTPVTSDSASARLGLTTSGRSPSAARRTSPVASTTLRSPARRATATTRAYASTSEPGGRLPAQTIVRWLGRAPSHLVEQPRPIDLLDARARLVEDAHAARALEHHRRRSHGAGDGDPIDRGAFGPRRPTPVRAR